MSNSIVENFENLFQNLSETEQKELIDHIFKNHIKSLNEGYFVGPFNKAVNKGLNLGPIPTSLHHSNCCPTCGRTL